MHVRSRSSHIATPALAVAAGALLLFCGVVFGAGDQRTDPELHQLLRKVIHSSTTFENPYVAEVWLVDMSRRLQARVPDPQERLRLLEAIYAEAQRASLPPELVLAVIEVESNFDRWAISTSGAQGLMQIMPFWLEELDVPEENLFHVQTNLRLGCTILRYYLDKEAGNLTRALARYNGSLGSYGYPNRVFRALEQRWFRQ